MNKTVGIVLAVSIVALLPIASIAHEGELPGPMTRPGWAKYAEECGACHLAYPPGFLPRRSWDAVMGGLDDHFGQNAELEADSRERLRSWLASWAAESGGHRRSRKILRSLGDSTPLRITESAWWRRKHDEVSPSTFERAAVGSRANCGACHPDADQGNFDDDWVKIPRDAPASR